MKDFISVKSDGGFKKAVAQWHDAVGAGLDSVVLDAAEETAQFLLLKIRQDAHESGPEWEDAAALAKVVRTEANVALVFPPEAFDLEYGNPEQGITPRALVRANINQMSRANGKRFSVFLGERLFG